jgi:hypothetical protein
MPNVKLGTVAVNSLLREVQLQELFLLQKELNEKLLH